MPSYTIDLAIFRLKLLLIDNLITPDLEDRFSNAYPPFDPQIHAPIDWDEISLSTESEEDLVLPLRKKLLDDVERVEARSRVRDWMRDVEWRTFGGSGHQSATGDTTMQDNGVDAGRTANIDRNENQRSPRAVIQNKRDHQNIDSESEEDKPGKRRRSARIAAQQ